MTGKIDAETKFDSTDFRNTVPRFSEDNRKTNQALVDVITQENTMLVVSLLAQCLVLLVASA